MCLDTCNWSYCDFTANEKAFQYDAYHPLQWPSLLPRMLRPCHACPLPCTPPACLPPHMPPMHTSPTHSHVPTCTPHASPTHAPLSCMPPLWTECMTHMWENITFPQLRLRMVKMVNVIIHAIAIVNHGYDWTVKPRQIRHPFFSM